MGLREELTQAVGQLESQARVQALDSQLSRKRGNPRQAQKANDAAVIFRVTAKYLKMVLERAEDQ